MRPRFLCGNAAVWQMPLTPTSRHGRMNTASLPPYSRHRNMKPRELLPSTRTTPALSSSGRCTMLSRRWASPAATFWNRPWVWAISSGCCLTAWRAAVCTVWSWTASPGASRGSFTQRPTSPSRDLKRRTGATSSISPSATCLLATIRSTTGFWASSVFPFTTTSSLRPLIRCARAA